jgi:ABC-2 type transport system ATP-binding protein
MRSEQSQVAVSLQNVHKTIGKKKIIKGLTFDIYPGEVFGFLGPNGAGKTTTIRMIVGLMRLSEGNILIHGKSIKTQFKEAIEHVGAIVENPEMYKFMTGYQNLIHYSRMVKGVSKERLEEIIALVGLKERIHDKVKTYSLGMRQRLGLGQALLHSPSVLILDEPTNGLDPAGIREIREYIRDLAKKENMAVIVSSHLLSEMELMCDRIGIIQHGELIGVQTVNDFVHSDQAVTVRFTVDHPDAAKQLLEEIDKFDVLKSTASELEIILDKEQIPEVVQLFVQHQINIYGIITLTKSLEDKFLEVTGGKGIV